MDYSTPGFPVHHCLPEFAQAHIHWVIDAIQLCRPLLPPFSSRSRSFPASGSFPVSGHGIGTSALSSVLPMNIQLISFRIDWFNLLSVQGTLKSLLRQHSSKASVLWHSTVFMVYLSHSWMTTGKTVALTIQICVSKEMSLLLNTLSRFVIASLPRCKSLLISWLQSPWN